MNKMDSKKRTIVLVEKDTAEKENFIQLSEKENWNVQAFASSYEAIQWIKKNNDVDLAIIANDATPLNAHQTYDYIRSEIKLKFPILISKENAEGNLNDGYFYINKPFTQESINRILQQFSGTTEDIVQSDAKAYSLNYLNTIAGDNHDFLIDCLRTFISSVSGKMEELKTAVNSNNNKDIGAIAHNIKPSFEMLENDTARDLCNILTYESETADIHAVAAQLEHEFIAIESALKNDFSELR